ncbi:MAG: hypothetical protein LC624_04285, partial [Halobacteriales archaeon]|nr:hypothetical protein [Halobacteriales archaeon]
MPLDPSCGRAVPDDALAAQVAGETYRFCSRSCRRRFTQPERALRWSTRMAAFALGSGGLLMVLPWLGLAEPWLGAVLFALGTAVQALAGWPFYEGLRRAKAMDALVALGTS